MPITVCLQVSMHVVFKKSPAIQNDDWPSTLLSLAVVKGEVRAIPVVAEDQDCHGMLHKYWESPILLKEGDAGQTL